MALQHYYVLGIYSVPYVIIINYTFQDYRSIMEIIDLVHPTQTNTKLTMTNCANLLDVLYCG